MAMQFPKPRRSRRGSVLSDLQSGWRPRAPSGANSATGESLSGVGGVNTTQLINGSVTGPVLTPGAIDITAFASSIRPVSIVNSLPTLPDVLYPSDSVVILTSDHKLYRNAAGTWTRATDGLDITADSITAGQIAAGAISASEIASNAVTTSKLLVGAPGQVLNLDPNCADASAWDLAGGTTVQTISDGKVGNTVLRSATGVNSNAIELKRIPVDPLKTYYMHVWVRRNSAADGVFYLLLNLLDSTGTIINGDGTYWFYPASAVSPPANTWTEYTGVFGPGTTKGAIPSNARTMSIGVLMNYPNPTTTAGFYEIQDIRVQELIGTAYINDLAVTTAKIANLAVTNAKINDLNADKITAGTIDADVINVTNLNADNITTGSINGAVISLDGITRIGVSGSTGVNFNVVSSAPAIIADGSASDVPLYLRPKGNSAVIMADAAGQHVIIGTNAATSGKLRMQLGEFISWRNTAGTGNVDVLRVESGDSVILGSSGTTNTKVSAITAIEIGATGGSCSVKICTGTGSLGFFGLATPITKRTGVAVTAAGIHAALVAYGLIAA